jgi:four helix bundle protein
MQLKYEKLDVWQLSMRLSKTIYKVTEKFPQNEIYGLTSQLRRATLSVPLNIAEGSMRQSSKEFVQFIRIAIGSLVESRTCLAIAKDLSYMCEEPEIQGQIQEIYFKLIALEKSVKAPADNSNSSNKPNNSNQSSRSKHSNSSNISNNSNQGLL